MVSSPVEVSSEYVTFSPHLPLFAVSAFAVKLSPAVTLKSITNDKIKLNIFFIIISP